MKRKVKINWEAYEELLNDADEFDNVNDPKRYLAPKSSGLYLIGNTLFNPMTNEQYFLIKVGESSNLYNRMKSYRTTNPMVFHIDYFTADNGIFDLEHECHSLMLKMGFTKTKDSAEWFLTSKETYLEICEKGFDFFMGKLLTE
jgi:hypothetical protein